MDQREKIYSGTILDYLKDKEQTFDSVVFVFEKAGLAELLERSDYTLFAPTNHSLRLGMAELNQHRRSIGENNLTINDIDSTSWRAILDKYLVKGNWESAAFINQDPERLKSARGRWMYASVAKNTVSGVIGVNGDKLVYSSSNGSKYIKNWINASVATHNLFTLNGVFHILDNNHVMGFGSFISLASAAQNDFSAGRVFSTGITKHANLGSEVWPSRVKRLNAIDHNSVELEIANLGSENFNMILEIQENGKVTIKVSPSTLGISILPDYKASYDKDKLMYLLEYTYSLEDGGDVKVNEVIKYEAD